MRMIDADKLLDALYMAHKHDGMGLEPVVSVDDVIALIDELSGVDAVPVVHGRWVVSPGCLWPIGNCSVCGEQHIGINVAKYCQNCGAKMDGEAET